MNIDWRKLPRPYRRTGKMVNCATCGKLIYRPAWQLRDYPISFCSLSCRGKKYGRIHPINFNFFDIWTPDLAYLLGLLAADGCVRDNGFINFVSLDIELLKFVRDKISPTTPISDNNRRVIFWSVDLRDKLISFGIVPRKSKIIKFPTFISDNILPDFIRGVLDGDGSIDKIGRISFCSGSRIFLVGLVNALKNWNISCSIYAHTRSFIIYINVKNSIQLAKLLYNGNFCLKRKYRRARFI